MTSSQNQSHNSTHQQFIQGNIVVSQSQTHGKKKSSQQHGTNNNGWDDDNHDYIIHPEELFYKDRYKLKERIGKGSFGQVVRALDLSDNVDVAIKIIKSKKPFLMQAKTEIELLNHLNEKDTDDQHNIGKKLCWLFFFTILLIKIFSVIPLLNRVRLSYTFFDT